MGFGLHFLDSGAFSQVTASRKWQKANRQSTPWGYFDLPEHFVYLDGYVQFVKEYAAGIDYCANVDVIGHPELTYRNQKYLEQRGLAPVPVVHYGSALSWLQKYMDEGYDYIGLGGLAGKLGDRSSKQKWIDQCFLKVADAKGIPRIKLHGFGVSGFSWLTRYPWYSVDSSSWIQVSRVGLVLVPRTVKGEFCFTAPPYYVAIGVDSTGDPGNKNIIGLSRAERELTLVWLDWVGVTLEDASCPKIGFAARARANIKYYHEVAKRLPSWPWAFRFQCGPRSRFDV